MVGGAGMFWFRKLTADQRRTIGNWFMELVIVVAGVLIALWLQQWGEHRKAIANMKAAEEAIHDEIRATMNALIWRQAISKCHFDRAVLLRNMLMKTGDQWPGLDENALSESSIRDVTGVTTAVPSVYQRPADSYATAAWNSALATGALAPMDGERFAKLVQLYDQVQLLAKTGELEDQAAATLSALALPQRITPETRTKMLQALYEIDRSRFVFDLAAGSEFPAAMRELGWNDKAEVDRFIGDDQAEIRRRGIKFRPCVAPHRNPFTAPPPAKD
jgi:hypothetical protein